VKRAGFELGMVVAMAKLVQGAGLIPDWSVPAKTTTFGVVQQLKYKPQPTFLQIASELSIHASILFLR